jgi:hypothetical protein
VFLEAHQWIDHHPPRIAQPKPNRHAPEPPGAIRITYVGDRCIGEARPL